MRIRQLPTMLLCLILLSVLSASALAVEFPDVSLEHWAHDEVARAADYGLVQGLEDGSFQPEETMNRAAFVTILQRMFAWESVVPDTPSFADVPAGHWAYAAVETARAHGVLEEGAQFLPAAYVTREDMAVMLVRALGYETLAQDISSQGSSFPDVSTHPGHISLARAIGMTNGTQVDGQVLFQPASFATRGEAAAMLVRVYDRYTSKLDYLHAFYAFSSYDQISYTARMDGVSVGWARMSYTPERGPWLNSTKEDGNDWVKPQDSALATDYFQGNGTPYHLNVFADTTQSVTLPDGSKTSALEGILSTPEAQAQAIAALAGAAGDYAGITIDFEGLRSDTYRAAFVTFMTNLRSALPADKALNVCVPPDDWYKGYDYRALGEVSDKVILMAHDYQWPSVPDYALGSPMGTSADTSSPVTPFASIYRALLSITDPETGVRDRSKIVLQISFGTACFTLDDSGALASKTINHPGHATIAKRLGQPDTVVSYDEHDRNPIARYTGDSGEHFLLWYEDARSVSDKLDLARMFGINGVSLWRLGTIPSYPDIPNYDVWAAILEQR